MNREKYTDGVYFFRIDGNARIMISFGVNTRVKIVFQKNTEKGETHKATNQPTNQPNKLLTIIFEKNTRWHFR